jgi:hypothetical protein
MADVTINGLTPGTPAGNNILPYSTGANTLSVSVSALFHNAGNIGIGTSNPVTRLTVNGDSFLNYTNTSGLLLRNLASENRIDSYNYPITQGYPLAVLASTVRFQNASNETMRIDAAGNVGIGTSTPQARLDVNGNMYNNNLPMYGIRAWVRFSGANDVNGNVSTANTDRQIIASGNITRVNRTSLGNYDIYITTGFANTNYSVVANIVHAVGATTAVHIDAYSSTSSLVKAWCSYQPNTISYDPSGVDIWIIG